MRLRGQQPGLLACGRMRPHAPPAMRPHAPPCICLRPHAAQPALSKPPCACRPQVLEPSAAAAFRDVTLAAYLETNGYSDAFRRHYLLPMCAAVWSVPNAQVLEFPVQMLVRFW